MVRHGFSFGVPPSLGREPSWSHARDFADMLYGVGFATVIPFKSYKDLEHALLGGELDAAWAPPLACAHVERIGGTIVLRGVRAGEVCYRAALVSRARDMIDLSMLTGGAFRPRVAWVDDASIAGYRLPRAHLRKSGIEPNKVFLEERFLGSYAACIEALGDYRSDLTSLFCGKHGLEKTWGNKAVGLRVIATTEESPNDGVAISPSLDADRTKLLVDSLVSLANHERVGPKFAAAFEVDGFDQPPAGTYIPLLSL